jgi:hypothetical protein
MTCRHNIEHAGCPSCQQWRAQRNRRVSQQQHARFDSSNHVMQVYLQRRYPA